jgi:hypothetical protein
VTQEPIGLRQRPFLALRDISLRCSGCPLLGVFLPRMPEKFALGDVGNGRRQGRLSLMMKVARNQLARASRLRTVLSCQIPPRALIAVGRMKLYGLD